MFCQHSLPAFLETLDSATSLDIDSRSFKSSLRVLFLIATEPSSLPYLSRYIRDHENGEFLLETLALVTRQVLDNLFPELEEDVSPSSLLLFPSPFLLAQGMTRPRVFCLFG